MTKIGSEVPELRAYEVLADGTELVFRPLRSADRALLARGFAALGADSRYQRFMVPKQTLSDAELVQLTELDGALHYALGVVGWDEEGCEVPLAVARFVRETPVADRADAAITVVDAVQGRGLGKLLLRRLAREALRRGIHHFVGDVLIDNPAVAQLIRGLDANARFTREGAGSARFVMTLLSAAPPPCVLALPPCHRASPAAR